MDLGHINSKGLRNYDLQKKSFNKNAQSLPTFLSPEPSLPYPFLGAMSAA